jgi:hypothetical protein
MPGDYRQTRARAIKNHEAVMKCLCICGLSPFSDGFGLFYRAGAGMAATD